MGHTSPTVDAMQTLHHSTGVRAMLQCTRLQTTTAKEEASLKRCFRTQRCRRRSTIRAASKPENGETTESLFAKELKRRGIPQEPLDPSSKSFGRRSPPSEKASYEERGPPLLTENQLQRARELSSEGLEGLIPRAKELLTLGGTFTLSFVPSIMAVAAISAALYLIFGASLIHFGSAEMTQPTYVNPYELLGYPYTD